MIKVRFKNGELLEIENSKDDSEALFNFIDSPVLRISEYVFWAEDVLWMYSDVRRGREEGESE